MTFDGDVTLYEDGQSLTADNPVISRILNLLSQGLKIGIVTAAGYTESSKYYDRLFGLLDAMKSAIVDQTLTNPNLIILGGESNYLFTFDQDADHLLKYIPRAEWLLEEMRLWTDEDIIALLDVAEKALRECIDTMALSAQIVRKDRAVGIIPMTGLDSEKFTREQLEETVLLTQQIIHMSPVGKRVPFCAFNGELLLVWTLFISPFSNALHIPKRKHISFGECSPVIRAKTPLPANHTFAPILVI